MPIVIRHTGGFGCTCPAFRRTLAPLAVIQASARSVGWKTGSVVISGRKEKPGGSIEWDAKTSDVTYTVTYSPDAPGGVCKHIIACLAGEVAWVKDWCVGAKEVLEKLESVTKELKVTKREIQKMKCEHGLPKHLCKICISKRKQAETPQGEGTK